MTLAGRITHADPATNAAAIAIGIVAALGATVLMQLSPVWLGLVTIGLLVFCGSLVASDAKLYWLSIFLGSVPLSITKLFFWTPEDVTLIKQQFGIYINETMVPQMYLSDLPLAMLLVMWLGEVLSRRRRIEIPRALVVMGAFLLWAMVTVAQSRVPLLGLSWVVYEVKLAVMFVWFVNARLGRRGVAHAIGVLLLSLALQSGVTVYTYFAQTGENVFGALFGVTASAQEARGGPARGSGAAFVFEQGALLRGTGTIGTANLQAKYFVLLLPLALGVVISARRTAARLGAGAVLVGGLAALYLTYSRGGLLCALIALALIPILLVRRGVLSRKAVVTALVGAVTAAALASPVLLSFLGSRPGFTRTRFDQALYGVQIWWRTPLAGVGMNNFNTAVSPIAFDGTFSGSPIHNHYLRIAIETGVIGFVLYFGFFAWALRLAYRLSASADRFVAAVAGALCAALVGIGVYWLEDLFYDPIIRTQIWITVALTAVLAQVASSDPAAPRLTMLSDRGARLGSEA